MEKEDQEISDLPRKPERIQTGVLGLDALLCGGLIKGGMYLLLGPPGSGKTILGNQIGFHHAKENRGNVVYVTLLAESHNRMMSNLRNLDYFEDQLVARSVHYMSGYPVLETEGLKGLLLQIAGMIREHKATLLIVDGVTTIGDMEQTPLAFRKFAHELNNYIATSSCTAFLLSSMDGHTSSPEHTMVDGIIALHHVSEGLRAVRQIEVRKFRGSNHQQGKHLFLITACGVRIYPRLEAMSPSSRPPPDSSRRLAFKVPNLDTMLGGGLISNSITTLIGQAGTGKTLLGLQFLRAGAELGERGLFFGFYESSEDLCEKGRQVGFDLSKWIKDGTLELHWMPALEQELDVLGETLIESIVQTGATRVVVDGVDGFRYSASVQERVKRFLIALTFRIKALGVTLILIEETSLFQSHTERPVAELAALNENLLYLRHIDHDARLMRAISIIKVRNAVYDPSIREFSITQKGIDVLGPIRTSDEFLTGMPRRGRVIKKAKKQSHSRKQRQ